MTRLLLKDFEVDAGDLKTIPSGWKETGRFHPTMPRSSNCIEMLAGRQDSTELRGEIKTSRIKNRGREL